MTTGAGLFAVWIGGAGVFWTEGTAADGFLPEQAEPASSASEIAISVNLLIFISIYDLPPIAPPIS